MFSEEQIAKWVDELQQDYTSAFISNKQKFTGIPMSEENIHDDVRVYADIMKIDSRVVEIFLGNACYDMDDEDVVNLIMEKLRD